MFEIATHQLCRYEQKGTIADAHQHIEGSQELLCWLFECVRHEHVVAAVTQQR